MTNVECPMRGGRIEFSVENENENEKENEKEKEKEKEKDFGLSYGGRSMPQSSKPSMKGVHSAVRSSSRGEVQRMGL